MLDTEHQAKFIEKRNTDWMLIKKITQKQTRKLHGNTFVTSKPAHKLKSLTKNAL